jgi:hypothetical protein
LPNKSVEPDFGLAAPLTLYANPKRLTINVGHLAVHRAERRLRGKAQCSAGPGLHR